MIYRLGDNAVLDLDTVELQVDGDTVSLEPQVFDVMSYLVVNADRVVTKEEILDNVWGDRFVSESALTSRVKDVRKAVGDDGRAQKIIRTVHGRGYRWVGTVVVAAAGEQAPEGGAAPSAESAPSLVDDGWPLVGRQRELDHMASLFRAGNIGGVLLTGPAGMGKTRLADEVARLASCGGLPVAHIRGHAEARDIPLACVAHLLPTTFAETAGPDGELSRGLLFQEAIRAFGERAGGGRLVLLVDDVDRTDDLSQAVISSLVQAETVFVVATQRTDDRTVPALKHLVSDSTIERVDLGPLPDDVLGVALYRTLRGPLDPMCVQDLLTASGGSPGVLRQLVERSIHDGRLRQTGGVWGLAGDLSATADLAALVEERLSDLEDEHREAAELLALAGALDIDVATALAGEEQLDALDLQGMLHIEDGSGRTEVRLAHPLYGEVLRGELQPLRTRRLRSRLADLFDSSDETRAGDRLRVARWRVESGGAIDPGDLLETARLAVLQKDHETARQMLDRLQSEAPSSLVTQLDAELQFRMGQPSEVERLLAGIDLDELDPTIRTQVVRRRTMNLLYGLMENERPFEILDPEIEAARGEERIALESHRLALRVMTSALADSLAQAEALLPATEGFIRLEVLRSLSYAQWGLGRPEAALNTVVTGNRLALSIGPSLSRPGLALSQLVEIFCLIELGRMQEARTAADRIGMAVPFGWLPAAIARVALHEARPGLASELLANPLGIAEAVGQEFVAAWLRAITAETERMQGNLATAVELAERVQPYIEDRGRVVDLDMMFMLAPTKADSGDLAGAVDDMLEAARRAAEVDFAPGVIGALFSAARWGATDQALDALREHDPPVEGLLHEAEVGVIEALPAGDDAALSIIAERLESAGLILVAAQTYQLASKPEQAQRLLDVSGELRQL